MTFFARKCVLAIALTAALPCGGRAADAPSGIIFGTKLFLGSRDVVAAKGTLTGDWLAYKNNTFSIYCTSQECWVASVNQIGPNQVGNIDGPLIYPVSRWTPDAEVVAENIGPCVRVTITLDRLSETVLWVETPVNQTELQCKDADNRVRKATIEPHPFWQPKK